MTPERETENQILDYLAISNIRAWKIKSVGTFDPVEKRFRRPNKRYKLGVADILGIYRGRPLAIEVKSRIGRLSIHQEIFMTEWRSAGGFHILARSIEDVEKGLREIDLALSLEKSA